MATLIVFAAKYLFAVIALGMVGVGAGLRREQRAAYLLTAVVAGLLAVVLTKTASALYFDPRPFTLGVPALIPHDPDNGFPSDHVVLSVTAAFLALVGTRWIGLGLFFLALIVGIARVLAGLHAPVDVVAGAVIGIIAVLGANWISHRLLGFNLD